MPPERVSQRITCDWDHIGENEARRRLEALKLTFPNSRMELWKSQSKNGFQLVLWINPKDYVVKDFEDSLRLRRLLSDDPTRMRIDRYRHNFNVEDNVLFTEKSDPDRKAELVTTIEAG